MTRRDPVTQELVEELHRLDRGCVPALYLGAPGPCRDRWGHPLDPYRVEMMTVEHVRTEAAMGGRRAKSDTGHTLMACSGHGVQSWELKHKDLERGYCADRAAYQRNPLRRCCDSCWA